MIITVNGLDNVEQQMARIVRGVKVMANTRVYVGSRLPYAFGEEMGRHRKSGKLARRDGGAFYLTRAKAEVLSNANADISEGLTRVTAPGAWVIQRLAKWTRRLARSYAPVGSGKDDRPKHPGRLRKSIHIERAG